MFLCKFTFYCVLLLLYVEINHSQGRRTQSVYEDDEVKNIFAHLLNNIVKVNEERVNVVEKITNLQDFMLTKNKLKTDDVSYDSFEDEENQILLTLNDVPELRRKTEGEIARGICNQILLDKSKIHLERRKASKFFKQACEKLSIPQKDLLENFPENLRKIPLLPP